jgi:hypothetical protein
VRSIDGECKAAQSAVPHRTVPGISIPPADYIQREFSRKDPRLNWLLLHGRHIAMAVPNLQTLKKRKEDDVVYRENTGVSVGE